MSHGGSHRCLLLSAAVWEKPADAYRMGDGCQPGVDFVNFERRALKQSINA